MKNATQQHSLNELTTELTAFSSFAQFTEAMDRGYLPTLQTRPARKTDTRIQARNELITELADRLESLGWKVWRG